MSQFESVYNEILKDPEMNTRWKEISTLPSYAEQRSDRLGDMIMDWLGDDTVTSKLFYESILYEVEDNIQYHQKALDKYKAFKALMTCKDV
jgi:hypothetical protein